MRAVTPKVDNPAPGDDQLLAADWNQMGDEAEAAIVTSGQTLAAGDLEQLAKAMAIYAMGGDFYEESSASTTVYVVDPVGTRVNPDAYTDGVRVRFRTAFANTTATPTLAINGLAANTITNEDGSALSVGQLSVSYDHACRYDSASGDWFLIAGAALAAWPEGHIRDCRIQNNAVDSINDIDFLEGSFRDKGNTQNFANGGTIMKQTDVAWATGAGGVAAGAHPLSAGIVYCFLLGRADGSIQAGFDNNIDATNLLADANVLVWSASPQYRAVGAFYFGAGIGGLNVIPFLHDPLDHDFFWVDTPSVDYADASVPSPQVLVPVPYVPPFSIAKLCIRIDAQTPSPSPWQVSMVSAPTDWGWKTYASPDLEVGSAALANTVLNTEVDRAVGSDGNVGLVTNNAVTMGFTQETRGFRWNRANV